MADDPRGLLDMLAQNQVPAAPQDLYGGKTLAQILTPAALTNIGNQEGFVSSWGNTPATNEAVSYAIQQGARYQPEYAKQVMSSGPEGGWFSIPSQPETQYSAHYGSPDANPAPGLFGMSTNNWRLLPPGDYQNPGYSMRAGHLIQNHYLGRPFQYAADRGADAPWGLGGPGHGFPTSQGSPSQRGYFFPGQLEPWINEGGPGTT